ncbi:uncharacterized protein LOC115886296 [Sitophilus oryzae]|uniref:Uncharacterized protein LOC115886296 n=1 Tax=Sitophilus oryzae TaxID=7048 RepID=A0A6J2YBJ9_SITOR|nr:uncharacterized protein LOC115886296 [Sitophilus oryzae]
MNSAKRMYGLETFFRNQKFVDCTFVINNKEVRAHKLVLASRSLVFEKMLYGDLASDIITLDDVQLEDFNRMLEYIYTDQILLKSINNAWTMLYLARKYLLDDLTEECVNYISDNLTLRNLVLSYEYSELYNITQLRNRCLADIVSSFSGLFVADYHMKSSTLRTLLVKDLGMPKVDLMLKIIDWTITECDLQDVTPTPEIITDILRQEDLLPFFNKKWLLDLTCEYCSDSVLVCQCFGDLIHNTLVHLSGEINWEEESHSLPRIVKPHPHLCKSKKVFKIACRIDLREGEEFSSEIVVDTTLVVSGLVICSEMKCSSDSTDTYKGTVMVRFVEQNSKKNLSRPTIVRDVFTYDSQVYIPLRYAVVLFPGKVYNIRVSYKNYMQAHSSIVCSYMSDKLESTKPDCSMFFFDWRGSIIRGVTFYPL